MNGNIPRSKRMGSQMPGILENPLDKVTEALLNQHGTFNLYVCIFKVSFLQTAYVELHFLTHSDSLFNWYIQIIDKVIIDIVGLMFIIFVVFYFLFLCLSFFFCHLWVLKKNLFGCMESLVVACGIQFPDQGSNPSTLHWECGILATGPPGSPCLLWF